MIRRVSQCQRAGAHFDAIVSDDRPAGTLDADSEAARAHLESCLSCRAHVAQLRRVRRLLSSSAPSASAPDRLSARLTSIAGEASTDPLWMAADGRGRLDSPRARRRRVVAVSSATTLVTVVLVLAIGLALSPSLPRVANAAAVASLEYDLSTGSGPVAGAVNAVQAVAPGQLRTVSEVSSPRLMSTLDWTVISPAAAKVLLTLAGTPVVGYRGVQRVMLGSGSNYVVADVMVAQQPGHPLTLTVLGGGGRPLTSGLLSAQGAAHEVTLPPGAHAFQRARGGQIAGVATTLLEAHRSDGSLAARWWVSEGLGLVLWSESFDADQNVVRSAGFVDFVATSNTEAATTTIELSTASQLIGQASSAMCLDGFTCSSEIEGLSLIELRSDSASRPTVVCALYGRGDVRVSVTMRRGQLTHGDLPYGISPDRAVIAWQSGTVVYTVTTNGGSQLAAEVAEQLPHLDPVGHGPWERAKLGLQRLFSR